MKSYSLFRPPINPKNRSRYSRADLHKMYTPQLERGWRHGIPKWHVDVNVVYIRSTHHITRMQLVWLAGIAFGTVIAGGSDGGFLTGIVDDSSPGSHVVKDLIGRDCDADLPIAVFTMSDDGADASGNRDLSKTVGAMADSISQKTGQWIKNVAKNVVR